MVREPDETGCGCRHEFNGQERGMVEFIGVGEGHKGMMEDTRKQLKEIRKADETWDVKVM